MGHETCNYCDISVKWVAVRQVITDISVKLEAMREVITVISLLVYRP